MIAPSDLVIESDICLTPAGTVVREGELVGKPVGA